MLYSVGGSEQSSERWSLDAAERVRVCEVMVEWLARALVLARSAVPSLVPEPIDHGAGLGNGDVMQPACCPYLFYDDVPAAIAFLKKAFGLEERFVDRDPAGNVSHAQLGRGDAVIMIGETGTHAGYRPRRSVVASGSLNGGVYLFVEDVDAHARNAVAGGAKILMEPADTHWGDRLYCAEDPEGQFWMFAARIAGAALEK